MVSALSHAWRSWKTAAGEFGAERLKTVLRSVLHLAAPEISERLTQELRAWIKDTAQYDDLTFVVMKVL